MSQLAQDNFDVQCLMQMSDNSPGQIGILTTSCPLGVHAETCLMLAFCFVLLLLKRLFLKT